jgi:hypothetical protein
MRKLPLLIAGALVLALGTAGIAQAFTQNMDVRVQKTKAGTKKKPRAIGTLTVDLSVDVAPTDPPFATTQTVIHFDKNLVFNYKRFPTCTEAQARAGVAVCRRADVGGGTAEAFLSGARLAIDVDTFNGPRGQFLLKLSGGTSGLLVGHLRPDRGPFGSKLVVNIPEELQRPGPGLVATLTKFFTQVSGSKTARKGKKRYPYIGLKGCSGGRLRFKGDFTFTDGSKQIKRDTVACRK